MPHIPKFAKPHIYFDKGGWWYVYDDIKEYSPPGWAYKTPNGYLTKKGSRNIKEAADYCLRKNEAIAE